MKEERDNEKKEAETNILDKIDYIMCKDQYVCIDVFPKRIISAECYVPVEEYYLTKKNVNQYIQKITNVVVKLLAYYEMEICIPEPNHRELKKFSGLYDYRHKGLSKFSKVIYKLLRKDECVVLFDESNEMVVSFGLYNSAIYFLEKKKDMELIKKIVESEGLFLWESTKFSEL